jgi:hypothetical protein
VLEALAERLAHAVPGRDPLDDDGELVEREDDVEVEVVDVAPGLLRVQLDDLVPAREPGLLVDRLPGGDDLRLGLAPVEKEKPDVGERVAERRHLPIEDRGDAAGVVGRQHRVVEAVVAVHDGRRARLRQSVAQPARHLVNGGQVLRLGAIPLLAPPAQLALHEPVGMTEVPEADGLVVDAVNAREHVDELS